MKSFWKVDATSSLSAEVFTERRLNKRLETKPSGIEQRVGKPTKPECKRDMYDIDHEKLYNVCLVHLIGKIRMFLSSSLYRILGSAHKLLRSDLFRCPRLVVTFGTIFPSIAEFVEFSLAACPFAVLVLGWVSIPLA